MNFYILVLRTLRTTEKLYVRSKHKSTHWSVVRKKDKAINKALEHFDDFYKQVYTNKWNSIREGLLKKPKHVAVVNNFGDNEETKTFLENSGAMNMRRLFHLEKQYINEKYEENKKHKLVEQIIRGSNKRKSENKLESEVKENQEVKRDYSLETSLKNAEIDESRIIDEKLGMTAAIMSQFLPATEIKGKDDWIPESDYYKLYEKDADIKINVEKEFDFHFPEKLDIYCFDYDSRSKFTSPRRGVTGVFNYYIMDGGSILPILALDLKPGQKVLDMCAAPGGKSYLALQTLYPDIVVCNDSTYTRTQRILDVLHEYFYDLKSLWFKTNKIKVTHVDGRLIEDKDFDRILVDVPCSTDRHSVTENDNNLFKSGRIKDRLKLPELQCELLVRALKLIKQDGVVVYSTCTLSPIQNDGVVHRALKQISMETNRKFVIKDMSLALLQARKVYNLADHRLLKFGHLVLPNIHQNYGPTYFCKIERIK